MILYQFWASNAHFCPTPELYSRCSTVPSRHDSRLLSRPQPERDSNHFSPENVVTIDLCRTSRFPLVPGLYLESVPRNSDFYVPPLGNFNPSFEKDTEFFGHKKSPKTALINRDRQPNRQTIKGGFGSIRNKSACMSSPATTTTSRNR